jgi:hypothetical protein
MGRFFMVMLACVIMVSGCRKDRGQVSPGAIRVERAELFILNWADYIPGDVIAEFEKKNLLRLGTDQ